MPESIENPDAAAVAIELAKALDAHHQEYAFGGAIALGYWAAPRGTVDVDVTLFISPDKPSACVWLLQDLGCQLTPAETTASIREHGFCRVEYGGVRVDVFLPTIEFYDVARSRRRVVTLGEQPIQVWDAESLVVFKLMFFRRKDLADIEQILRTRRESLDCQWIEGHLVQLFGRHDPRVMQWQELRKEVGL
ncbi:MAG: hypothetical protein ACKV0T_02915 [Planctomycetales bacterium]